MKIEELDIDEIEPNPWNPNEMTEEVFQHLKEEYERVGNLQPILVRELDDNYQIIDGEHRWKAQSRIGEQTIDAVVVEDMDDHDAKMTTLNMNDIKGSDNPIKKAELLEDLEQEKSKEQLSELLDLSINELEAHELLLEMPEPTFEEDDFEDREQPTIVTVGFDLTPEEANQVAEKIDGRIETLSEDLKTWLLKE